MKKTILIKIDNAFIKLKSPYNTFNFDLLDNYNQDVNLFKILINHYKRYNFNIIISIEDLKTLERMNIL